MYTVYELKYTVHGYMYTFMYYMSVHLYLSEAGSSHKGCGILHRELSLIVYFSIFSQLYISTSICAQN